MIGSWIFQVDFCVGHIEIPADNYWLFLVQLLQKFLEGCFPLHAVGKTSQFLLGIWGIYRYKIAVLQLQGNHPSLMVMLLNAQSIGNIQWLYPAKYRCTGVPLLLCTVPILLISRQIKYSLPWLHLGLLNTEYICIHIPERLHKPLGETGSQAVDVPRNKSHALTPLLVQLHMYCIYFTTKIAYMTIFTAKQKPLARYGQRLSCKIMVRSAGVEPTLSAPEANVLSTGLRAHIFCD